MIEAGELRKNAPLRALCEKAKNAAVLRLLSRQREGPAAADRCRDAAAGLTIAPEARAALVPLLGGDRLASRSELQKLALYAHGKERVELEDVAAVVTDASALALDALVDADVRRQARRGRVPVHQGAQRRHLGRRDPVRRRAPREPAAQGAARGRRRPVGRCRGRRACGCTSAACRWRRPRCSAWSSPRLQTAIGQIADATLQSRLNADLAEAIVQRLLLSMAMAARRTS